MNPNQTEQERVNHENAAERCKKVRDWLLNTDPNIDQSIDQLIATVEMLGDDSSPEADEVRQHAGELWLSVAILSEDIENAREILLMGVQIFTGRSEADNLDSMLYLAEQGCILHRAIDVTQDQHWPTWFEEDDAPQNLTRLVKALDILGKSEIWPNLKTQFEKDRELLLDEMLPAFLEHLYQTARQFARDRNFAMANMTVETALKLFQHEIRPYVEPGFSEEDLHQLRDTLTIREQAEVALYTAAVRLTDPEVKFREVVPEISVLILNHPDVPVDDLNALIGDLYQSEKIEALYIRSLDLDNFTGNINTLRDVEEIHFSILDELPQFLKQADARLANNLRDRFQMLADSFNYATDGIAQNLAERIRGEIINNGHISATNHFLRLYWQANWCLRSGIIKQDSVGGEVEAVITMADLTLDALPSIVAEKFTNFASLDGLEDTLKFLDSTRELNQGFVNDKKHNQIKIHKLPALPPEIKIPEIKPKFDDAILEIWAAIINIWMGIQTKTPSPDQPNSNLTIDIHESENLIFEMMRDINVIKVDVWTGLHLSPWSNKTSLGILNEEVQHLDQLIKILSDRDSKSKTTTPFEALAFLDQNIKCSGLLEKIKAQSSWLIETYRSSLFVNMQEQYKIAERAVNYRISKLLKEESTAQNNIRKEILNQNQNVVTAGYLFGEIYAATDQLAQVYVHSGDMVGALSIWDTIIGATSPWKNLGDLEKRGMHQNPGVDEIWQELYRKTFRRKLTLLISSRKREIIITFSGILLAIILWISLQTLFQDTKEEPAIAAVAIEDDVLSGALSTDPVIQISVRDTRTSEPALTNTPQLLDNPTATQQVNNSISSTATQQVIDSISSTGTAIAEAIKATALADSQSLEATAQAVDATLQMEATATAEMLQCLEADTYSFEVSSGLDLEPPEGTDYITGTTPIQPMVFWELTNLSACQWDQISVKPLTGDYEVDFSIWRGNQEIDDLRISPVGTGESIMISLLFNILDATDIHGEWILMINDLELTEEPHLQLDVELWINLITPPSSRP